MDTSITPMFVFDPHDPGTSPGFVLALQLPRHRAALNQLPSKTLDFLTGGRAAGCLAVLLVGLPDPLSSEQIRRLHQLGRRWGVMVEAATSREAARQFGSWLLGEFHRLFHQCCEEACATPLQVACLRQMSRDAAEEFARRQTVGSSLILAS